MLSKSTESIDEAISKNVNGQSKFYDGVTHMGMFGIPKDIRRDLKAETRIMTMDNPVFMH